MKKKILAKYWKNKRHKNPKRKYEGTYHWDTSVKPKKRMFILESTGIGLVDEEWFESWQDAKAAGWRKCK